MGDVLSAVGESSNYFSPIQQFPLTIMSGQGVLMENHYSSGIRKTYSQKY